MSLDPARELGRTIASNINSTKQIQEDHVGTQIEQSLLLSPIDTAQVETTVTISRKIYPTTSFILDHPVYGDIDSSTLAIDGGYLAGSTKVLFDTYTG